MSSVVLRGRALERSLGGSESLSEQDTGRPPLTMEELILVARCGVHDSGPDGFHPHVLVDFKTGCFDIVVECSRDG